MDKWVVIGLSALLLASCGDSKKAFDDSFNKSFHEKFVSSCVSSAGGVDPALASKLCNCAASKVDEKYSVKEKMGLKNEQLMPIVEECKAENPA
jgi:hypothetical protein